MSLMIMLIFRNVQFCFLLIYPSIAEGIELALLNVFEYFILFSSSRIDIKRVLESFISGIVMIYFGQCLSGKTLGCG